MLFSWEVSTASPKANRRWYGGPWFDEEAGILCDVKEWLAVYRDSRVMSWSRYDIIIIIIIIMIIIIIIIIIIINKYLNTFLKR